MFTLTNIAVLSSLMFSTMLSGNIASDIAIEEDGNKNETIRFIDVWTENSVVSELVIQSKSSSKNKKIANNIEKKYSVSEEGVVPVTAYSSTPDQTDDSPFIMASGRHVYDGAIAANFLPIGTKVRFPEMYGNKVFTVEDRMNKRYSYKMDIWMETRGEAMKFGFRNLKYEIVKPAEQVLAIAR